MSRRSVWLFALLGLAVSPAARAQVVLQFDYSQDANNFFVGHPDRQLALQTAGQILTARMTDSLSAIVPGGSNTWTASIINPATGAATNFSNPTIPANTV